MARSPAAVGGKGNEGVAGQVRNTPGAIGYVELAYALQNQMNAAAAAERAGKFVDLLGRTPSPPPRRPSRNISATNFSIVECARARTRTRSAGYSWVDACTSRFRCEPAARSLHDVLAWLVGPQPDSESMAGALDYVPLPANVQKTAQATLKTMQL